MLPIYGCPEKFWESSLCTRLLFPEICNGLLFWSILRMCVQNLKFVVLPVPEILKKFGQSRIQPRSIFSKNFKGLLFGWTLWIHLPNLTFVALPIPEIIGGTSKIWGVRGFAHAPYSPISLKGFCSDGPCEPAKFEVRSFTRSWDNERYSKKFGQSLYTPTFQFLPNF